MNLQERTGSSHTSHDLRKRTCLCIPQENVAGVPKIVNHFSAGSLKHREVQRRQDPRFGWVQVHALDAVRPVSVA